MMASVSAVISQTSEKYLSDSGKSKVRVCVCVCALKDVLLFYFKL